MPVDFYRDTWVRYLGYANEVGEAFRPVIPGKVVRWSYQVAFFYVVMDTADKTWKSFRKDGRPIQLLKDAGDAMLWQTLASVIIPGFTINRISHYTQRGLCTYGKKVPAKIRTVLTVAVALGSIPIIVRPIDAGVTVLMNNTYRRWI